MSGIELPGFAEPVLDAQACFRAVLDAMARPGRVLTVRSGLRPPAPLGSAAASILLTLADSDTALWLDPAASAARDWIAFHSGAPLASDIVAARFVLALDCPSIAALHPGAHEAPEQGATLILQVRGLGEGPRYRLSGPGVREPRILAVAGLPEGFVEAWAANYRRFPQGIDLLLCAGAKLAAVPRSVTMRVA